MKVESIEPGDRAAAADLVSAAAPLTAREEGRLRQQIAALRHIDAADRRHERSEWDKGALCLRIKEAGLWRRAPEFLGLTFVEFVARIVGLRSRTTVERRMTLAACYSRDEYLEYVQAGTGAVALVLLARAEGPLRPHLRQLALSGLTVGEAERLREAGAELLAREHRLLSGEGVKGALLAALRKRRLERAPGADQAPGDEAPERRHNGQRGGAPDGADDAPAAAAAETGGTPPAEAHAGAARAHSPEAESAAALEREAARLRREVTELTARLAAAEEAGRRPAPAARTEDEDLPRERAAGPDAREQALDERAAGLDAREQALAAREQQATAAEQALQREAEELGAARAQLDLDHEALGAAQARLAEDEARVQAAREQLDADLCQLFSWLRAEHRIAWPDPPWSLDGTLLRIDDTLFQVVSLCRTALHQLNKERQLPTRTGLEQVYAVKETLDATGKLLRDTLKEIGLEYRVQRPEEVERFLAAVERDREAVLRRAPVQPPRLGQPKVEFRLPTRAILGTPVAASPQHGVLGLCAGRDAVVTLDMNGVQTVGVFGQQNAGKSNTLLVLAENALGPGEALGTCRAPMAVIQCHYHADPNSYPPGFATAHLPNDEARGVQALRDVYGARPRGLAARRRIVFVPPMDEAGLERRRADHPGAEVRPLRLSPEELGMDGVRLVMGATKSAALYMLRIQGALAGLQRPSPEELRGSIGRLRLSPPVRDIVEDRLRLLDGLLGPEPLGAQIGPGDFVGLDMRAPWMDELQAMTLFTLAMNAFAGAKARGEDGVERPFHKMMIFDEAHKYMGRGTVSADILRLVREMRHRLMWVVYASQDPESVHPALLKLSSVLLVHQLKAQASMKVLRESFAGCELKAQEMALLQQGEARVMAVDCADPDYRMRPQPLYVRPSCARPGGTTRLAVPEPG